MIDFNIEPGNPVCSNRADLVIQQIDILFDTNKDEVFGDTEFGTEYDRYLYNLKASADSIKNSVLADMASINLLEFRPEVEVYLLQGTEQDIIIIDIVLIDIYNNYNRYEKTYKITRNTQ